MNWLFNCFNMSRWFESSVEPTKETNTKGVYPKMVRTYIADDIYKDTKYNGAFWNTREIWSRADLMQKIYEYIAAADKIIYYCGDIYIISKIWTERFGWCRIEVRYDGDFFEFMEPRNGIKYEVSYKMQMEKCPDLYNFVKELTNKAHKEYIEGSNL